MTITFFFHLGYLIAWDDYGVAFGWGMPKQRIKPGASRYRFYREAAFPWWVQPGKVRQRLFVAGIRRKQARHEKKRGGK